MPTRFSTSLDWISQQQPRMVELLQAWSGINSGSYHIAGLAKQAAAILPLLRELGGDVQASDLLPQSIISDIGNPEAKPLGQVLTARSATRQGPRVLLAIHYDTVYGPDHSFQAPVLVDNNTMRGPGVCDAKGGLLVLLFALLAFERAPFASSLNWEVLLNPDEELGSPGSATYFDAAAARNDLALLFEPALPDGALVSSRKGSGNFTIIVHGRSAHAGRNSEQGRNAIHAIAAVIEKLAAWQTQIPGIVINTGFIHGGGPVNIVPDRALCRVNVRVETSAQQHALQQRFATLSEQSNLPDGIRIECLGGFHCPPKPLTPAVESLLHHLSDCGEQLKLPLAWRSTGGACDGNRLAAAGLPTLDSLGVCGGNIHTDQEFVHLDSLAERACLVALFLMRLASGEIALESITDKIKKPLAEVTA